MRKNYIIYTLSYDEVVFYVGMTSTSLKTRLSNHMGYLNYADYPVYEFIRSVHRQPDIKKIETVRSLTKALIREKYWINKFCRNGIYLYNRVGNKSITNYKRTDDEFFYDCYKDSKKKIPYKYSWVAEWRENAIFKSMSCTNKKMAQEREKVRSKYMYERCYKK